MFVCYPDFHDLTIFMNICEWGFWMSSSRYAIFEKMCKFAKLIGVNQSKLSKINEMEAIKTNKHSEGSTKYK